MSSAIIGRTKGVMALRTHGARDHGITELLVLGVDHIGHEGTGGSLHDVDSHVHDPQAGDLEEWQRGFVTGVSCTSGGHFTPIVIIG
jgi:hypothetical protein